MKKWINQGILTLLILSICCSFVSFAESDLTQSAQQSVTATTDGPQPRRSCFSRGTATLTQVSGRNLMIEAQEFAYHDVDRISMTVYLEKLKNGVSSVATSWKVSEYNADYADLLKSYTVSEAANYRLYAVFSTKHAADGGGTEGASATTSWMWID